MTSTPLTDLRQKIDNVDSGILALLDERVRLAAEIAEVKKQQGLDIFDPERERELLANLVEKSKTTDVETEKLLEIWGKIIELSRRVQS